jgi:antitoxin (DNA-binding transcriptional repressor) of toxin-antitoxin stability system
MFSYNGQMNSVNIADLKNNLSRHLARVREGAELTVLDRDTPIARILPFAPRPISGRAADVTTADREAARARIEELQRLGILGAGDPEGLTELARTRPPVKLPKGTPSAVDTLIKMRRESMR